MRATIEIKMADWGKFYFTCSTVIISSFFTNILCKSVVNGTEDEDFEPQEFSTKQSDKWEGEDEDDNDVKAGIYLRIL